MVRPMIDAKFIDDLAKRVAGSLPTGLQVLQEDLQKNIRSALESGLGHLELVTREEFELQRAVLARTREKLERLEKQIENLEQGNKEQE
jgi:BMFP domain-containing protein YqiC